MYNKVIMDLKFTFIKEKNLKELFCEDKDKTKIQESKFIWSNKKYT